MIVYGWNTKNIKQAQIDFYECPSCKEKNSVLAVFASYVHIFWIPLFPYKKSAEIQCSNCQYVSTDDGLVGDNKMAVKQLKSAVSIPKYLFSGAILIVLFTTWITYGILKNSWEEQSYIENPLIGDVYLIKDSEELSEYNHYFLKVGNIEEDSLWVSLSSYSYNGIVDALEPEDGFYDVMYAIHKDVIKNYQESGMMKKVIRDYSSRTGFDRVIEYQLPDSLLLEGS